MTQFPENTWTDGRTEGQTEGLDRQILFYRTLAATAEVPTSIQFPNFRFPYIGSETDLKFR